MRLRRPASCSGAHCCRGSFAVPANSGLSGASLARRPPPRCRCGLRWAGGVVAVLFPAAPDLRTDHAGRAAKLPRDRPHAPAVFPPQIDRDPVFHCQLPSLPRHPPLLLSEQRWCSLRNLNPPDLYSKRWGVEPSFRDTKDLRFGLGLSSVRISDPQRRDRLLLLNAFAVVLLTLLGAAGESLGMDRHLKSNTVTTRTHSLFRQGCMLYDLIPNMPEHRLRPLVEQYAKILQQSRVVTEAFAIV